MWNIETVRFLVELKPGDPSGISFWSSRNIAVKDDGTRVSEAGGGREGEEFFKYEDSDMSFDFTASRHDSQQNLTSVYTIYLHLPNELKFEKVRTIALNIRSALLALPPSEVRHKGQPPTSVVFNMHFWNKYHPDAQILGRFP